MSREPPRESLFWFERALELAPNYPEALQGKGVALIELGEVEEGRRPLERLLRGAPERQAVRAFLEKLP